MKVRVKVLMNRNEIAEANQTNQMVDAHNSQQMGIAKKTDRVIKLKVDVPEPVTEERDLYIDASKIELAGENEYGMISMIYCGRDYQVVKTDELMAQLEARFDEKINAYSHN